MKLLEAFLIICEIGIKEDREKLKEIIEKKLLNNLSLLSSLIKEKEISEIRDGVVKKIEEIWKKGKEKEKKEKEKEVQGAYI